MTAGLAFLFFLLAYLAEVLGTVGGFGSSVFFVPMAACFLDFETVLGVTALFHVFSNAAKIGLFRNGVNMRIALTIGIPAVVFVIAGAWATAYIQPRWLEGSLAAFLILLSISFLIRPDWKLRPSMSNSIAGGSLSGFLAGLLGTGGAIRGMTMAAFDMRADVFIATSALIDMAIDLSRATVYFGQGYVHTHDLWLFPGLLGVALVGTWTGKIIVNRFSQERFRKVVLLMLLAVGIFTLLNFTGLISAYKD